MQQCTCTAESAQLKEKAVPTTWLFENIRRKMFQNIYLRQYLQHGYLRI
jgi:hypothetical protein